MVVLFLVNDGLRSVIIDPVIPGIGLDLAALGLNLVILILTDGLLVAFVIHQVIISTGNRTAGIVFCFRYFVLVSILIQIIIGLAGRDLAFRIRFADESVIFFLRDLFRSAVVVILGIGGFFCGITLCVLAVLSLCIGCCGIGICLFRAFVLGSAFGFILCSGSFSCLGSGGSLSDPSSGLDCRYSIVLCLNCFRRRFLLCVTLRCLSSLRGFSSLCASFRGGSCRRSCRACFCRCLSFCCRSCLCCRQAGFCRRCLFSGCCVSRRGFLGSGSRLCGLGFHGYFFCRGRCFRLGCGSFRCCFCRCRGSLCCRCGFRSRRILMMLFRRSFVVMLFCGCVVVVLLCRSFIMMLLGRCALGDGFHLLTVRRVNIHGLDSRNTADCKSGGQCSLHSLGQDA